MSNKEKSFSKLLKTAVYVASICGVGYFAAIIFLHIIGQSMTALGEWAFRIAIIIAVIWAIVSYRVQYARGGMGFVSAFGLGMMSAFILGIYMSLTSLVFHHFIAPDYNQKFEAYYRAKRSAQMYNTQQKKQQEQAKEGEIYKLTTADSVLVEKGLDLHIQKSHFYFTANGAAAINLIFSIVWGIVISLSVAFMARKK
jgi:uncharacterized membrane protein YhdT